MVVLRCQLFPRCDLQCGAIHKLESSHNTTRLRFHVLLAALGTLATSCRFHGCAAYDGPSEKMQMQSPTTMIHREHWDPLSWHRETYIYIAQHFVSRINIPATTNRHLDETASLHSCSQRKCHTKSPSSFSESTTSHHMLTTSANHPPSPPTCLMAIALIWHARWKTLSRAMYSIIYMEENHSRRRPVIPVIGHTQREGATTVFVCT